MADTKISALPAVSAALGAQEIPVNDAGTTRKLTATQLQTLIGGLKKRLTSQADSVSTTPAKITGLDLTLGAGTYTFEYFIRWRTATAATGIKFDVNHSGTVTSFVWNQRQIDLSATAATAIPSQNNVQATAAVMMGFSSRAKGTAGRGVLLSADTLNSDMLTIIEGLVVVTVSGNLELYHGAEAAASGIVSVMPDTVLRVTQYP
jgi:hypothetical protein